MPSGGGTSRPAALPAAVTTLGPVGALAGQADSSGQASDDDPGWWNTITSWFSESPERSTGKYQWLPGREGDRLWARDSRHQKAKGKLPLKHISQ